MQRIKKSSFYLQRIFNLTPKSKLLTRKGKGRTYPGGDNERKWIFNMK